MAEIDQAVGEIRNYPLGSAIKPGRNALRKWRDLRNPHHSSLVAHMLHVMVLKSITASNGSKFAVLERKPRFAG